MPLRPLEAEQWVASLIDWDSERAIAPEALIAFGEYVAAACIPDPAPPPDGRHPSAASARRTAPAAHRRRAGPTSTGEGAVVTDDQHGEGAPQAALAAGAAGRDYDADATAFVKLPEGG